MRATIKKYFSLPVKKLAFSAAFLLCFLAGSAQQFYIGTFGGNGSAVASGDNSYVECAGINNIHGICFNGSSTMYFADGGSIRKIDLVTHIVTTIAGNAKLEGYSGDGGPAKNALLKFPFDLCLNQTKTILYFSEFTGQRIRKIDLVSGIISTVAGDGTSGYNGDGIPAVGAQLSTPRGLCIDAGDNLYVADINNQRIRKIDAAGNISTFAGNGSSITSGDGGLAINAGLSYPTSLCTDPSGNIYILEAAGTTFNNRLRKIDAATGIINTIAGTGALGYSGDGGPALAANLNDPAEVFVDNGYNIFITEYTLSHVRRIDAATGIINTIAGNGRNGFSGDGGPALDASLFLPIGMAMDNTGSLYIGDNYNHRIRKINVAPFYPYLKLNANPANVCNATPVTFTATLTNAGTITPVYNWKKNSMALGVTGNTYTATTLGYDDTIFCSVSVPTICGGVLILKDSITHLSVGVHTPSITIAADKTDICKDSKVNFTATLKDAGPSPAYQWQINNSNAGTNSNTFSFAGFTDGDVVTCKVILDPLFTCATSPDALSNAITIAVINPAIPPTITINATKSDLCRGEEVTFTAHAQNGGPVINYQWIVNGKTAGSNSQTFTTTTLENGDKVMCNVTSGSSACSPGGKAASNIITMSIKGPAVYIQASDSVVISGSQVQLKFIANVPVSTYVWSPPSAFVDPSVKNPVTQPITADTKYFVHITDRLGCSADASLKVILAKKLHMPTAFTPNGDGINDVYRIPPGVLITLSQFSVYDRWGKKIFATLDPQKGWDGNIGGQPMDPGAYVYVIDGVDSGTKVHLTGSFVLLR